MAHSRLVKSAAAGIVLVVVTTVAATVGAQTGLSNPYREDANWGSCPLARNGEG